MKLGFFDNLFILSLVVAWGIVGSLDTMHINIVPGVAALTACIAAAAFSARMISR